MISKTSILLLLSSLVANAVPIAEPDASDSSSSLIPVYHQCGGSNWTGATQCVDGATCASQNEYYHQCVATADSGESNNAVAATTTSASNTVISSNIIQSSNVQKTSLATSKSVLSTKAGSNAIKTASTSVSTKISSVASSASAASSSASASSDSSSSSNIKTVSGGFSGSTDITRYWDCCAPSFCWEGKSNSTSGRWLCWW
ncbi:unnamed protein product [Ambrosiozyma monospora]|uniref:Unnamed protein product n=1 Tax=Ambrosiozyma monospora TaxID=43982 RepID=A0A9W7DJW0_AMBMO|nr:unnamed protein product [Ambrosiozyma monospora]